MWWIDPKSAPDLTNPAPRIMTFGYVSVSPEAISAKWIRKTALKLLEAVMELRNMGHEGVLAASFYCKPCSELGLTSFLAANGRADTGEWPAPARRVSYRFLWP